MNRKDISFSQPFKEGLSSHAPEIVGSDVNFTIVDFLLVDSSPKLKGDQACELPDKHSHRLKKGVVEIVLWKLGLAYRSLIIRPFRRNRVNRTCQNHPKGQK